jgi:hypothetical protein
MKDLTLLPISNFTKKAQELNSIKQGDQAAYYLTKQM